jgi:hypothetical protein
MLIRPGQIKFEKRLGSATTLYETVALSFVIPSEAEGSAVPPTSPGNAKYFTQTKLSSRPEESWVWGPPELKKNAFCPRPLSMEAPPSPLSSRPKRSAAERFASFFYS